MRKKIMCAVIAVMMFVFTVVAAACGGGSPDSGKEGAATQNTQTFVNTVTQIDENITLSSGPKIEVALTIYGLLNDSEKKNQQVIEYKTVLDGYKATYDVLKAAADKEEAERQQAKLAAQFVEEVDKLPNMNRLTIDDRAIVDGIKEIYDQLNDTFKAKAEVVAAYAVLAQADAKVTVLEKAAHEEEVRAIVKEFIEAVGKIEEVTLAAGKTIEDLLYDYEDFTDEIKNYEGVAEAKQTLDGYYAEYIVLRDENDVNEFKKLANALNPVTSVTLESERTILNAEAAYRQMSDEAKNAEGVAEALVIVQKAREKFNELFAIAEKARVERFIELANQVRTDVENVDITWYDALYAVSTAYTALTSDSQELPEVEEAFNRWNTAQKAFDKKGYKQIPMKDPTIVYSGNYPPYLVLQNDSVMFNAVKEFFGVSTVGEISEYAIMWLNIYKDGVFIARGEIDLRSSSIEQNGHIIHSDAVQAVFRNVAADHPELVSGGRYGFSLNFEDREGEFIPSARTAVSKETVYTW